MKFEQLIREKDVGVQNLVESLIEEAPAYKHFLIDCPPRTGKSRLAVALCNLWEGRFLILSNSVLTNEQWLKNLKEYNPHLVGRVDLVCYQSLHKVDKDAYTAVFLDEFECALSDKRIEEVEKFKCRLVGMSGSMNNDDINEFRRLTSNKFFYMKITLEMAVNWGILPQPKILNVKLSLDNTKRYLVYHKGKDKSKKNTIIQFPQASAYLYEKKTNVLIQCTEVEYLTLLNVEYNKWKGYMDEWRLFNAYQSRKQTARINNLPFTEQEPFFSNGFLFIKDKLGYDRCFKTFLMKGLNKKKFFASLKSKHFRKIYNKLPKDSRCLVFCQDTAQANLLNEEFAIHSKRPGSKQLVDKFNNKEINQLFSVGQLNRGQDFIDVDYIIILQTSGESKENIQQAGRAYLSKSPKIIVMYYPDTQDAKYVEDFLKAFKKEWIVDKTI